MPKPRAFKLETATARRRLAVRKKPYWITVSPNIRLGYRRNEGAGTWNVNSTADGADWIKRLGLADDLEPADGVHVLTYWQAIDAARKAARSTGEDVDNRPVTVAEAIDRYEADLRARGGDPRNASQVRGHVPTGLAARLVSVLTATELKRWRNGLLDRGMASSSVNRTRTRLRAALNLAAAHDPERIANTQAWRIGLAGLPDAHRVRDVAIAEAQVLRLIACAREIDPYFGLLVEVLAVTGARASQAARLTVADLQVGRLMMPTSRKGKARKTIRHYPVPIPAGLAAALTAEAKGRPGSGPLVRDPDGAAWGHSDAGSRHRRPFREAATAAGLDPDRITPYALRHSSIIRQLQRNVPIRLVASAHDTSVAMIERTYSAYIAHHGDEIVRAALLDPAAPAATTNVLPLSGRRA